MAKKKSKKKTAGRPFEGRVPFLCHVNEQTKTLIDGMVIDGDPQRNSRGKLVEMKFNSVD
tara:strand:+ start:133 stop:312 length:180 start_codon:yes stop_codon:yes gene_type:complete